MWAGIAGSLFLSEVLAELKSTNLLKNNKKS